MRCKICTAESSKWFDAWIMDKHLIDYFYCKSCGFLQTEDPYWLGEVYKDPVSIFDTGVASRNIQVANKLTGLLFIMFRGRGKFVDYAGGFGLLTRLMRDKGFDYYWTDQYAQNLFSRGFTLSNLDRYEKISAVTAIECFEHLPNPLTTINEMFSISDNIIFTTETMIEPPPVPSQWWYYALSRGGHISFYSKRTLNYLADLFGAKYYNVGIFHILSKKPLSRFSVLLLKAVIKLNIGKFLSKIFLTGKTKSDYIHIQAKQKDG